MDATKSIATTARIVRGLALFCIVTAAGALPGPVRQVLPQAQTAGSGLLRVWGFDVYRAQLWVAPGFRLGEFHRHPLALEVEYLRGFSAADLARRSVEEMRRQQVIEEAQAERWRQQLQAAWRDVRRGDRLLGVHRPGEGVTFFANGQPSGEVRDAELARLFFGIWLSEQTSEPALRAALVAAVERP